MELCGIGVGHASLIGFISGRAVHVDKNYRELERLTRRIFEISAYCRILIPIQKLREHVNYTLADFIMRSRR